MEDLRYQWDERKNRGNQRKHGVAFEEARTALLDENARRVSDPDHSIGLRDIQLCDAALTACLVILVAGCRSPNVVRSCEPSATAVTQAVDYLIARDNAKDLAGVLAGYTTDVTWYPPQGLPLRGIEAIRPRYEVLFSTFSVALRSDVLEASGNGESGFAIGTTQGTLTPLAGGEAVAVNDRFVAIARCVAGEWKMSHLVWGPR